MSDKLQQLDAAARRIGLHMTVAMDQPEEGLVGVGFMIGPKAYDLVPESAALDQQFRDLLKGADEAEFDAVRKRLEDQ